jgi:parallel beta-helix repeat protein
MQRRLLSVLLLGLVLFSTPAALAAGDIYAGGLWGTRINSLPYDINASGAYYLGGNLSLASGNAITIKANDVTLDLMAYTVTATNGTGIYINGQKNVEIRNGTVIGINGIYTSNSDDNATGRVINVRVVASGKGIALWGVGNLIKGCEVTVTGASTAIEADSESIVSGCTVRFKNQVGIELIVGGIASSNVVLGGGIANSTGINSCEFGSLIIGNKVSNTANGIVCAIGASIIGNTVEGASSRGIWFSDNRQNMLDQNTVIGTAPHYDPSTHTYVQWRNNH